MITVADWWCVGAGDNGWQHGWGSGGSPLSGQLFSGGFPPPEWPPRGESTSASLTKLLQKDVSFCGFLGES